jgi:RNA polymerase sigma-70 factor (ECF subfamily)
MTIMAILPTFPRDVALPGGELDSATIARCRAGDRQAFRRFVLAYQRLVFAFLGRMLGGRAPVEDVAQEAFLRAYRGLATFDPAGPARLSTWMLAIARHAALDHLRRRPHEVSIAEPSAVDVARSPEQEASRRELGRRLSDAANALPDDQREAFLLFEVHGLSLEEVSQVVGAPLATVKTRCFRAREKLREALAGAREEDDR